MKRRDVLKAVPAAAGIAGTLSGPGPLGAAQTAARRGMPPLTITDVKVIATAPSNSNWTIVKVMTSEPGLYGLGSATHQEVPQAAQAYIEKRLKPFVIGKKCDEIEDIWQSAYVQEYFRSGPEGNNALSGIDGALWDILGKRLGVPVYQLLGGKVRAAVLLYGHTQSMDLSDLEDQVRKYMEEGYQVVRIQTGVPGFSGYGVSAKTSPATQALRPEGAVGISPVFDPGRYVNATIKMFDFIRSKVGFDIGLIHDVHERPAPNQAIQLCKAVEPYRPYYMEDCLSPEDVGWFQIFRQETAAPLAMGELFVNRQEWMPLVANRWIDFIRCHISANRRIEHGPKSGAHVRVLRRTDCMARPQQRRSGRPLLQSAPGSSHAELRHPRRNGLFGNDPGGLTRLPHYQKRLHVFQRQAGPGNRYQ